VAIVDLKSTKSRTHVGKIFIVEKNQLSCGTSFEAASDLNSFLSPGWLAGSP